MFCNVLYIVSMIRYDMYRRYIDPIHDTYRDMYRIIYSIQNIAETVIKNNIQTHYTCPTHFMQIEAGIEHVCHISNRNFQKFPFGFRTGKFVDNTF